MTWFSWCIRFHTDSFQMQMKTCLNMRWNDVPECDIFLVMPLWSKEQQPVVQQRTISATSTKLKNRDISQVTCLNMKPT